MTMNHSTRQPASRASLASVLMAGVVFSVVMLTVASQAASTNRPNLVLVMSDQQSWDMLGCYKVRLASFQFAPFSKAAPSFAPIKYNYGDFVKLAGTSYLKEASVIIDASKLRIQLTTKK